MPKRISLRQQLDDLRAEMEALRAPTPKAKASEPGGDAADPEATDDFNAQVRNLLEEAAGALTTHPLAIVAGALVLGIVIGRVTAR